jgi:hypothetical protein
MNITVTIESTDRTAYINWTSFSIENILNIQVDTCSFETKKYGSHSWKPSVGDEITVQDGTTKIFAGLIIQLEEEIEGLLLKYKVQCKDWTHYLDRALVIEKYEDKTIDEIISDINTNYLTGFTIANVDCGVMIKSITFNRLPVSQCLQILAEQVNYNWYVDYDKDIHFFAKNTELAPYNLTDTNGYYIFQSLVVKDDLSQMRNRVYVRGGEYVGNSRDENFIGDGTKKTFALGYKYSAKPTVTVGGVSQDVGIDYLDLDANYDVLWNYNEKYIRFVSAPADTAGIVVSGLPLIPIVVQVQDDVSIIEYGEYEFAITNKDIKSIEEARQYGASQLEAYASKISECSFETYESGLRSGQVINIQSTIRSLDEDYLIQRVTLSMRTPTEGQWSVELATMRTIGIVEFLQKLLLAQNKQITVSENEVLEKDYVDNQTIEVTEEITRITPYEDLQSIGVAESILKDPFGANTPPIFVLAPHTPLSHEILTGGAWYANEDFTRRIAITIDHTKVGGDLTDYPLYIDLSLLGDDFWANVQNGGGDIRITTSNGTTECPREIVSCDTATKTGEVHAKIPSVSSSTDTIVYLYYGNASAEDYAVDATYGAQNVWGANAKYIGHFQANANDSSASGNNGTVTGATQVDGKINKAYQFDGNADYINLNAAVLTPPTIVISLLINFDNMSRTDFGMIGTDTNSKNLFYLVKDLNNMSFGWRKDDGGTERRISFAHSGIISAGSYYHLLFIIDNVSGEHKCYVNSVLRKSTTSTYTVGTVESPTYISINNATQAMKGYLDEYRIYSSSTAFTQQWVTTEYNNQNSPATFYDVGEQEIYDRKREGLLDISMYVY